MLDNDILHNAVENLAKLTGTPIEIKAPRKGTGWDAQLKLRFGAISATLFVEIKQDVHQANIAPLLETCKNGSLVVARSISGPGKKLLEEKGVNYLDLAGNCYIKTGVGLFWHIKGQKPPKLTPGQKHRAFNKAGIKLLYALLLDDTLANQPYRTMAARANISVSTVGDILKDLKATHFLLSLKGRSRKLSNKIELLPLWVDAFNKKLKPSLARGRYRFIDRHFWKSWKQLDLGADAYWGAEPAGALLTDYLQPGTWTIYTNLDKAKIITDFKIVPDLKNGNVEICSIFWNQKHPRFVNQDLQIISPLLAYAELMGTPQSRLFETAQKIYERYLENITQ